MTILSTSTSSVGIEYLLVNKSNISSFSASVFSVYCDVELSVESLPPEEALLSAVELLLSVELLSEEVELPSDDVVSVELLG